MNREKNYNKLFNANPHVGVLDPLHSKKKAMDAIANSSMRHASAPTLYSPSAVESLPVLPVAAASKKPSKPISMSYHQLQHNSHELPVLVPSPKAAHGSSHRQAPQRVSILEEGSKIAGVHSKLTQSLDSFPQPGMVIQ